MDEIIKESDLPLLSKKGLSLERVHAQIRQFEKGFPFAKLAAPAILNDGILAIDSEKEELIERYENRQSSAMKFVPASGAATRMFKDLLEFRSKEEKEKKKTLERDGVVTHFFEHLSSFAFYRDLEKTFHQLRGYSLEEAKTKNRYDDIIEVLLDAKGLNYGELPKGLLKFHGSERRKTPTQEHLTEGEQYAMQGGKVKVHFTVSPEHKAAFQHHVEESTKNLSAEFDVVFSTQKPSTDTIAVDMLGDPFRMEIGELLFRPAGHGALLENLNELDADIIFIKNIDNVVPDRIKNETIQYKKALAGLLLKYQEKVFNLLRKYDAGENIEKEGAALLQELGIKGVLTNEEKIEKLNRPIRVCGMVKNEGEPGGGPFWVRDNTGTSSLQIVESAQIDLNNENQKQIFHKSTHFNPVDLVCGIKNYVGQKFDLLKYRDSDAGFISEKSKEGRKLRAMELPGLWNGSMADWNTIFVEVPLITFNPVKTVNDLLKENHR